MAVTKVDKETMVEGMVMKAARELSRRHGYEGGKETIEEGMAVMKVDEKTIEDRAVMEAEGMMVMKVNRELSRRSRRIRRWARKLSRRAWWL
jgi:hypothetical protein